MHCPDSFFDWRVAPDEPAEFGGPKIEDIFAPDQPPPGTYSFEVTVDLDDESATATFMASLE